MKKVLIFDFDGTIADTLPLCFQAFKEVFQQYGGYKVTTNEILAMFGPSETGIIRENLPQEAELEAAIECYYQVYLTQHRTLVKESIEIKALLHKLQQAGYQLALYTGKGSRSLEISLHELGLGDYFELILTGDDVLKPKPNPEGLIKIIKSLAILPINALYIGDSDADILAGKAAGMKTIGVDWLKDYQPKKLTTSPDYLCKSVAEFCELLEVVAVF